MSQRDILTFLEQNRNKWYSTKDLKQVTGANTHATYMNVRGLLKIKTLGLKLKVDKSKGKRFLIRL